MIMAAVSLFFASPLHNCTCFRQFSRCDDFFVALQHEGLTPHFRTIVTFDDVTAPKPAPAPYLLAAERLHVDPTRCLVFEDSDVGAEAAHRAGCIVVQVPDVQRTDGRFARHLADDLWSGARLAGLV